MAALYRLAQADEGRFKVLTYAPPQDLQNPWPKIRTMPGTIDQDEFTHGFEEDPAARVADDCAGRV